MSIESTRALLAATAQCAGDYLAGLEDQPVFPDPQQVQRLREFLDTALPETGIDARQVLAQLVDYASPATVASAGGRYFGFVTGGALPATLAANWLAGAWDQNAFSPISSPAIALLEETALGWLKEALLIPAQAEGALTTGATMANFTCLAAARHRVLQQVGWDVEADGLFGAPPITVVVGEEVHGSVLKVLAMLGLGRRRLVRVPVDGEGRMRADQLPEAAGPTILCMQAGNVTSGAFDPAPEIIAWARDNGAWVHVDGAFGLWAAAVPELAHLVAGCEAADSWATDAHKWLNVPYDCGAALVRDPAALHGALSISGAYLQLDAGERAAIDVTPDSSRRARAVDVWAAFKALGRSGLAAMVRRHCRQAAWLAAALGEAGIEILNEIVLNQVVAAFGDDGATQAVIRELQKAGHCWCGGSFWKGRQVMRISISSWATSEQDMRHAGDAILAAANKILRSRV